MKRAVLLACTLLSWGGRDFALDPGLDVSQYAHTAWKNRDGFAKGAILTIAQTPDGYLWLGTELGLLRFDGVRTVPFQPPEGQRLPSNDIRRLLSTADGTLWIGTTEGLASWKDGTLTVYPALTGLNVIRVLQDRDGSIWIGTLNSSGAKLCVLTAAKVQCVGEDGRFGRGVFGLLQDSKGVLWVGTDNGVWRWRPGPPQFYPLPITVNGIQGLAEDGDGSLLITVDNTLWRLAAGTPRRDRTLPTPPQIQANRLLRDRDGGVWVGTSGGGVIHMHEGRTEVFGETDGLSDNHVLAFHEDREGNVWVATSGGLDRFREFAAAIVSDEQGFSSITGATSVLPAPDGSMWIGSGEGLSRSSGGHIAFVTTASTGRARTVGSQTISALSRGDDGRIWMATLRGVGFLQNGRFVSVDSVPGGVVYAIAEDAQRNVWIVNQERGLLRLRDDGTLDEFPWPTLGAQGSGSSRGGFPTWRRVGGI
jgi:ligand-binding sensor domain-containing protein